MLRCPNCEKPLNKEGASYVCENHHCFDVAKSGYTNLYLKHKQSGDDEAMVKARTQFLEKGYYEPLRELLSDLCDSFPNEVMVDAGAGEGYYTNEIQKRLRNQIYGFDVSKIALQKAAKANKKVHYFVASIFDMPLYDASVDLILSVFAPLAIEEFKRVLKEDGMLITVTPGPNHLIELKRAIYDDVIVNEAEQIKDEELKIIDKIDYNYQVTITSQEDLQNLFKMTPYYYKTSKEDAMKLTTYDTLTLTCDFVIQIYYKGE